MKKKEMLEKLCLKITAADNAKYNALSTNNRRSNEDWIDDAFYSAKNEWHDEFPEFDEFKELQYVEEVLTEACDKYSFKVLKEAAEAWLDKLNYIGY
jgi:hypothetical protein